MEKKKYEEPLMKAYQVKPMSIICTSGPASNASFEAYEQETVIY